MISPPKQTDLPRMKLETIWKPMKTFHSALVALLTVLVVNVPLTVRSTTNGVTVEGGRFVELLTKGDFAGAAGKFDSKMKTAVPEPKLQELWQTIETQAGPFQKQLGARKIVTAGYDVAMVTCQFKQMALDIKVVFDTNALVAGLFFLPSQGYVSADPPYVTTNTFYETNFTVVQGKWHLPGTLTLPGTNGGPWPVVVLVHGSGPEDRDETGGANRPFRDLALGLASKGVAVLRYEKRTKEYAATFKKKFPDHFTVREETTDDALGAAAQLRNTKWIDPKRIFVLGHSLGGMLAPRIGQTDTNLTGLILLAGPTRPIEDLILEQTRYLNSISGAPSAESEAYLAEVQSDVAKLKKLTAADASSTTVLFGAQPVYWLDLRDYDPVEVAKKLREPVLILQGGRDYQVTQVDFDRWKEALGSQTNVTFKFYDNLNHQFITGEGKSTPVDYEQAGHVAEPVVNDIAEWVKSH
jgi:fermentation-respiration switch protein FrsA (DUF1100 family)